ncbi:uncharacterized protein NESG_00996 [Nematocida ausubeli]|uniref:RSE1/DDB1/CPSF1 second beta-propeller domain-containing protein n=1 Tax=Nematocida ausubeli (strain ATCC PRA-371 / ERTm2) TaxID=1913371 RepID=A0A086J3X2_NEMA1|nr:uncharacterized protein NESG_00996 [Nematocida ausubeli]KFG26840.1 hypothetical protein NESG_00996 [Nematocida ausubeli]
MLAQGTDLVASARGSKIYVYTLSEGMGLVTTIKAAAQISAVACALNDSFLLIGTATGQMYYYNTLERKELVDLESCCEVSKLSLKITSIFILNDIVYVTSENGTIRIFSIEITKGLASTATEAAANITETETTLEKDGWMEEIESIGDNTTQTLSMHISRAEGTYHNFKSVREIKHTTPITKIAVCGPNIYILDMRGRVIVFPSKVVYDSIADIHFRKYLFCIDGNTVFAEVGQVFTSVYFAKTAIKHMSSSMQGGFFFILTEKELEIMRIEEMGGKRVHAYKLPKEADEIVVDSKRSIVYSMCNGKPARMEIDYVWIDRSMEDLKIAGSTIKEVCREEEPIEDADGYFDIPNVKAVKDLALPSVKYAAGNFNMDMRKGGFDFDSASDDSGNNNNEHNSDIEDLFNADENSPFSSSPANEQAHLLLEKDEQSTTPQPKQHCIVNRICGPVCITNNQDKLIYWAPECTIRVFERTDYKQIEVTTRASSVEISILKELNDVLLACASASMLLLYTEAHLKIYRSTSGVFTESALIHKIEPGHKIERLVCGKDFFCIVNENGLLSNVSVYTKDLQEIYCFVAVVRGISASGDYLAAILEEGEGVVVRVFKYTDGAIHTVSSAYFNRQAIEFCGVSSTGVFVFQVASLLYALGRDRIIALSCTVPGIPIAIVGENVAYLLENENKTVSVHPEIVQYVRIERKCQLSQKMDIFAAIEKEMLTTPMHHGFSETKSTVSSGQFSKTGLSTEDDENTIFISKAHKAVNTTPRKQNTSHSDSSKIEHSPMHTPIKKVKHSNPFARNN